MCTLNPPPHKGRRTAGATHVLPQELQPVRAQASEVATGPVPDQQGLKRRLEVLGASEAEQRFLEVTPAPDLWKLTAEWEQQEKERKLREGVLLFIGAKKGHV